MKVLSLLGSPRKQGNTATLLSAFLKGLSESGEHEIREVSLQALDLHPCRNCDACRRMVDRHCVIDDDMQRLFPAFIEAQMVILASPIYWWSISAQLKLFIDRLYGLDAEKHPQFFSGKKVVLVFTHYEEEPCSGAEISLAMFKEIADYTQMQIVGDLRYSSGTAHVQECPDKLAEATALGRALAAK